VVYADLGFHITEEVYFGKAKDVVGELRSKWRYIISMLLQYADKNIGLGPLSDANRDRETQREMIMSMQK
jgi:capping protein beta